MTALSPEQEAHSQEIREAFSVMQKQKYEQGAVQHGGNLWDMPLNQLIREAKNEFVDGFTYVHVIDEKVQTMQRQIDHLKAENSKLHDDNQRMASMLGQDYV